MPATARAGLRQKRLEADLLLNRLSYSPGDPVGQGTDPDGTELLGWQVVPAPGIDYVSVCLSLRKL